MGLFRASKWVVEAESPFKKIQDDFRNINDAMGKTLMPLMMSYMKAR
jgi:hypothetical protein